MAKGNVLTITRWKTSDIGRALGYADEVKPLWEKYGAESADIGVTHSGTRAGQLVFMLRFSSWEAYGKVQGAMAVDQDYAKVWQK